jgi:hypothetical protein
MADPFHSNRAKKQEAVSAAYQKALSIPKQRPIEQAYSNEYPWDSKKVFLHPVHKYQMNEWEYNLLIQEEKDKQTERNEERSASAATERSETHGGVRENQQYTLALKTAFELGMNAGLMQRPPPPPCNACERRKERNRIAAQTSRVEKRKLEQGLSQQPRRVVRSTSGPAPPAPSFAYPTYNGVPPVPASASASTASKVNTEEGDQEEEEEDADVDEEETEETEIHPPPF